MYHQKIKTENKISIRDTLYSGQTFLWNNFYDHGNYYSTIINSSPVILNPVSEHEFDIYSDSEFVNGSNLHDFIHHYFTLDVDINTIFPACFSRLYPELWQLLAKYFSLKIIRPYPKATH